MKPCMKWLALAVALATAAPGIARAADYTCPATLDGKKLLNWKMADDRGDIPLREIGGSSDAHWIWTKGGNVRVVCGYMGTGKTQALAVARTDSHCVNHELSKTFFCN